jgi:starch-binding outer membrane protein, SusD/RagB family
MINKNILGAMLIASSFALITSCKKNLDQFPADNIELSQSFKTMNDAKSWDNGLYNRVRAIQYGSNMFSQDVQADQLNASLDYGNRNGNPHRWGNSFNSDDGLLSGTWSQYYGIIANINLANEKLPSIVPGTAAETAELNRYKGDALLARAMIYFELVKRYAKPFEPATASSTPGVPLVLTYDVNGTPARATLKACYDQIIADINAARTLVITPGVLGATRFNAHSVLALEAKVKLFMQDWSGAFAAADALISSGIYPLANTAATINAMWKTDAVSESILNCVVSKPNELPNTNAIYLGLTPATGKFTPDFIPSQWVIDSFANTDLRKLVYFEQKLIQIQGVDYPNVWLVNKYAGNPALFTGATTNYAHQPKVHRIAEMYLIAAEAGARGGGSIEAPGLARLNQLKTARGAATVGALTGAPLFKAVRDERFRELAFEGGRLWDLKRWHLGFTRTAPQSTAYIQTNPAASFYQLSIPVDDNKFTWGIPSRDLTTNPNLANAQNPGW